MIQGCIKIAGITVRHFQGQTWSVRVFECIPCSCEQSYSIYLVIQECVFCMSGTATTQGIDYNQYGSSFNR